MSDVSQFSTIDKVIIERIKDGSYDVFVDLGKRLSINKDCTSIKKKDVVEFVDKLTEDIQLFNRYICCKLSQVTDTLDYMIVEKLLSQYKSLLLDCHILTSHYNYGFEPVCGEEVEFVTFYSNMMKLLNNAHGIGNGARGYQLKTARLEYIASQLQVPLKLQIQ